MILNLALYPLSPGHALKPEPLPPAAENYITIIDDNPEIVLKHDETKELSSAEWGAYLSQVKDYINGLKVFQADFKQYGQNYLSGKFHWRRPDYVMVNYDNGNWLKIEDGWIYYFDQELKDTARYTLESTPLQILFRKKFEFDKNVKVEQVLRSEKAITLQLRDAKEPNNGYLRLTLWREPMRIHKWEIVDAQGYITTVVFLGRVDN